MPDKVNIGIVGCGRISDLHASGYLKNPHATVKAVCDLDKERAVKKAAKWGVDSDFIYSDYDALLKLDEINAVELLVPHHLHLDMTLKAAEAGRHVSVQKPMAMNIKECNEMIRVAEKNSVKLKVFENFRFYPPYRKAKQLLNSGILGRPSFIHLVSSPSRQGGWEVPMDAWLWRFNRDTCGGGPLVWDDGYHKFSLADYFLGDVEKVKAWIDCTGVFDDDDEPPIVFDAPSAIMWKYKAPRTYGTMDITYPRKARIPSKYYSIDERVEITGEKGIIWVNQCTAHSLLNTAPVVTFIEGEVTEYKDVKTDWLDSFINSVNHFIDAIRNDTDPVLTGEDGMRVQRFAQAVLKSAETGTEIRPEDITT